MSPRLDEYADLDTLLHRWDPRHKLIAFMVLIFAFSFVRDLRLLPAMLAVTIAVYLLSRLPLSFLWARLRWPGFFLLMVAVLLLFFSGTTILVQLGPLAVRKEGCLDLLLIVVKFFSILTTSIVLFGTTPFLTTVKAMRSLGLPAILTDMTLLSYRYIHELGRDLKTLEIAMRLRGLHGRPRGNLGLLASLAGTILVRSYEQADNVFKAMILRGYGQPVSLREEFCARPPDWAGLAVVLLVAGGFVVVEIFFQGWGG